MIPGIGTIANALAIIAGGIAGLIFKKKISKNLCDLLMKALGAAVIFIGVSGTLKGMLYVNETGAIETKNTMLLIFSLIVGTLVGNLIGIKKYTERFGAFLKEKAGAKDDAGFIGSFVAASLTVCIGAMAIVGSIEDGMTGNPETLFAKAVLDALIIMVFASVTGKGAVFSAIPVAIFQGTVTVLAVLSADIFTADIIANMSFVGSVLIFLVGINLMFDKEINVADMLPSVFAAIPLTFIPW